jgi:hypothetical protein
MTPEIRLIDSAHGPGRTTATLLASLTARLAALPLTPGAALAGALLSGAATIGRQVSTTAEGARLRQALALSVAGRNGALLWEKLQLTTLGAGVPPSPVLDRVRNDLALLGAQDLEETLKLLPLPAPKSEDAGAEEPEPTFLDCLIGLWALSGQVRQNIEALAAQPGPGVR